MSGRTGSQEKDDSLKKAVFLDRDGVILEEREYLARSEDVVLVQGAAEALRLLALLGLKVVVVTNQSGIGRGFFSEDDYHKVRGRMDTLLGQQGAKADAEYYCPHAPWESCNCRKPLPGLALRAARELGLDLARSFMVGDKLSDIQFARVIKARSILVRTGYGLETERTAEPIWDAVANGILEAVDILAGWVAERGDENGEESASREDDSRDLSGNRKSPE